MTSRDLNAERMLVPRFDMLVGACNTEKATSDEEEDELSKKDGEDGGLRSWLLLAWHAHVTVQLGVLASQGLPELNISTSLTVQCLLKTGG